MGPGIKESGKTISCMAMEAFMIIWEENGKDSLEKESLPAGINLDLLRKSQRKIAKKISKNRSRHSY